MEGRRTLNPASTPDHCTLPATPRGLLPPSLRVLFITGLHRTGDWLREAFGADGVVQIELDEAVGIARGLSMLRDELYDIVLISHEGGGLDALKMLDAIRAGSHDEQPILVLGDLPARELAAHCYEAGADAYLSVPDTSTRTLIWELARACERHELVADNRRLQRTQRMRVEQEAQESRAMLQDQWRLLSASAEIVPPDLPVQLTDHYRQLLRTYVIMGAGNLSNEMERLADLLAAAFITSRQAMQMHLYVLNEMLSGLGARSARHIMNRASLLQAELLLHLSEGYRNRLKTAASPLR
ncbi:MAG: response regulator transcription factor [Planctomycetales bacterium]|nr:response regulator transcription factor [Planctomycetales bacterium]